MCVGLARTIYTRCIYGILGREITKFTVIYNVYIQFSPTLLITYSMTAVKFGRPAVRGVPGEPNNWQACCEGHPRRTE